MEEGPRAAANEIQRRVMIAVLWKRTRSRSPYSRRSALDMRQLFYSGLLQPQRREGRKETIFLTFAFLASFAVKNESGQPGLTTAALGLNRTTGSAFMKAVTTDQPSDKYKRYRTGKTIFPAHPSPGHSAIYVIVHSYYNYCSMMSIAGPFHHREDLFQSWLSCV